MSFSRLLQNAPYYSPAAFSPSRKRQQHPDSNTPFGNALQRRKVTRPLVDPYATFTSREFDTFVDDVSTRIRDALTYEPNKDRRIRRGYADDEEYWDKTGGQPGHFLEGHSSIRDGLQQPEGTSTTEDAAANVTQASVSTDALQDLDVQMMLDGLTAQVPAQAGQEGSHTVDGSSNQLIDNLDSFDQALQALAPLPTQSSQSIAADVSIPHETQFQIDPSLNQLYPSLNDLESLVDVPLSFDVNDLHVPATAATSTNPFSGLAQEPHQMQQSSIEGLLQMTHKDAEEATEAIEMIQQAEEQQAKLDAELVSSLALENQGLLPVEQSNFLMDAEVRKSTSSLPGSKDQDVAVAVDTYGDFADDEEEVYEDGEEDEDEEAEIEDEGEDVDVGQREDEYMSDEAESLHVSTAPGVPRSKEASAVISIDSSSEEEEDDQDGNEDEDESSHEDEDEGEDEVDGEGEQIERIAAQGQIAAPLIERNGSSSSAALELSASEDEEEEEEIKGEDKTGAEEEEGADDEEDDVDEATPPPIRTIAGQGLFSRQLFGELDEPNTQVHAYPMSQRVVRHMDENDMELSGFGSTSAANGHTIGRADDDSADEWKALRNIARRRQHQQDEQDVADRYFNDEEEEMEEEDDEEEVEVEDKDEDENEEDMSDEAHDDNSAEWPPAPRNVGGQSTTQEFEDELDDDAVAEEQQASLRAQAELEQRVPVPSFMKLDKETGNYEVKSDSIEGEDEEDSQFSESGVELQVVEDAAETYAAVDLIEDIEVKITSNPTATIIGLNDSVELLDTPTTLPAPISSIVPAPSEGQDSVDTNVLKRTTPDSMQLLLPEPTDNNIDPNLVFSAVKRPEPVLATFDSPMPSGSDVIDALLAEAGAAGSSSPSRSITKAPGEHIEAQAMPFPASMLSTGVDDVESPKKRERTPSRRSVTPARRARQSVEPHLVAAIAVSPDNFTLHRRATPEAVSIPQPAVSQKAEDVAEDEILRGEISPTPPQSEGNAKWQQLSAMDAVKQQPSAESSPKIPSTSAVQVDHEEARHQAPQMIIEDSQREDHHFERPPPELQSSSKHPEHARSPPAEAVDLTTDEMETHSATGEEHSAIQSVEVVGNDYHHVPPPPVDAHEVRAGVEDFATGSDVLPGVDFTTDEMEAHSAGDQEEIALVEIETEFTEDHHHEPPPPGPSDSPHVEVSGQPALSAVDFTTDEMESHSVNGQEEEQSVDPTGNFTDHEPPPEDLGSSEAAAEGSVSEPLAGVDITTDEMEEHSPEPLLPTTVPGIPDDAIQAPVDASAQETLPTLPSSPGGVPPASTETPTRTYNIIQPGSWDPSTPIRFGGRSLEAAVREAYYDPERSANLRKSLAPPEVEGESSEDSESDKRPTEVAEAVEAAEEVEGGVESMPGLTHTAKMDLNNGESSLPQPADFVPLQQNVNEEARSSEDEQKGERSEGILTSTDHPNDIPASISSSGLKEEEGETHAAQDDDYVVDPVSDALADNTSLPDAHKELSPIRSRSKSATTEKSNVSTSQISDDGESVDSDDDSDDGFFTSLIRPLANRVASATTKTEEGIKTSVKGKGKVRASDTFDESNDGSASTDEDSDHESSDEDSDAIQVTSKRASGARVRPVTPERDDTGRNIVTTVIVPGSPVDPRTPLEEMEVTAMLAPSPAKPRLHRHGKQVGSHRRRPSGSSRSSTSRTSSEPSSHTTAAQVHPHAGSPPYTGSSPIQTRSQCTYRKLLIPNPYLGSLNTPGRRMSTRLARAAGETGSSSAPDLPASYIFLVPGCVTADRKDKMEEGDIVDLGVASVEEEGSAMALVANEDSEHGLRVEGLPDQVLQSLIRVVGIDMFREGDCELLSPKLQGSSGGGGVGAATQDKKRRRESDLLSPKGLSGNHKRVNYGR